MNRSPFRLRALGVVIAGALVGAVTCAPTPPPDVADAARTVAAPATLHGGEALIPDVAERAVQSIVNISSTRKVTRRGMGPEDPFFFFFGPGLGPQGEGGPERRQQSLGSGVVVKSDGVILTNNHVVEEADDIRVTFSDGREAAAQVIGTDPKSDVAVIRVKDPLQGLKALPLGDSDRLRLGETVLAIGSPFGLAHTVTHGIVSAKGRSRMGIVDYEDFIQTDAAINPGNSGGALVNLRGELVGINTAIFSRSGGSQGIGFAIPVNMARSIMDSLVKFGKVRRGWLGVVIQDLDADLARTLKLPGTDGALVSDVSAGSPAASAGLQRGDVVVGLSGQKISSSDELRNRIALLGPDVDVDVELLREGARKNARIRLGELPGDLAAVKRGGATAPDALAGATLSPVTPELRRRFEIPDEAQGVVVTDVDRGTAAAAAGLRPGDVIVEINRTPVRAATDVEAALRRGDHALLLLLREGRTLYRVLKK